MYLNVSKFFALSNFFPSSVAGRLLQSTSAKRNHQFPCCNGMTTWLHICMMLKEGKAIDSLEII
jgi:hypothetical protein